METQKRRFVVENSLEIEVLNQEDSLVQKVENDSVFNS